MKALVATVATFLSVSVSCAEPVRVLSGEHSDFSRIVLVFGRDVGWSQQKTLEGFSVAFDRSDLELELGQVCI